VKLRWIANGWDFGNGWDSYMEPPGDTPPFDIATSDDGWWIDEVQLTGAVQLPVVPDTEPTTIPPGQCPTVAASCDELAAGSNSGFLIDFRITESNPDGALVRGESIILDASQTANPGGCAEGVPEFRFWKDPSPSGGSLTLLQDWSTAASVKLGDTGDGDTYKVEVRCSSDVAGHCSLDLAQTCGSTADCTATSTGVCVEPTCFIGGAPCDEQTDCPGGGNYCQACVSGLSIPNGSNAAGCLVFSGAALALTEPTVTYSFTGADSNPMVLMSQPNFITGSTLVAPNAHGHTFVRTDAVTRLAGPGSGNCPGGTCTITTTFKSIPGAVTTPVVPPNGTSSCDVNGVTGTGACALALYIGAVTATDSSTPGSGLVYYYLGNVFRGGAFAPWGPGSRLPNLDPTCP
jgi:hypothetical protein